MQHRDRDQFVNKLLAIIGELYPCVPNSLHETELRQRIDPLLDHFLFECQAITDTEATILMADIRGFTSLTEHFPLPTIIAALNRYFRIMSGIVKRHGGLIDKFMGDAVMALFGVPEAKPDDVYRAVLCAVEMQRAMERLNRRCAQRGDPMLYIGIAINTGPVMAGSFGSSVYNEYTVIGDAVNLTARMEAYSLRGQILLSETTQAQVQDRIEIGSVNEVSVKGKSEPIALYELNAINYPRRIEVPRTEIRKSPRVQVDLPLALRRVESKRILTESFHGRANDLGYYGMNADLPIILSPYTEVLINVVPAFGTDTYGDVYARVLRAHSIGDDGYRTNLEFTGLGTPGHARLKRYVDQLLWRR
jgi:adenylate cyclase